MVEGHCDFTENELNVLQAEYHRDYSDCKNNENGKCSLFGTKCRIRKDMCLSYESHRLRMVNDEKR